MRGHQEQTRTERVPERAAHRPPLDHPVPAMGGEPSRIPFATGIDHLYEYSRISTDFYDQVWWVW